MGISQSHALTLALALGYEYWLKQWWSDLCCQQINRPIYNYALYRFVHFILLLGSACLLLRISWIESVVFSACLVLLGSLELLVRPIIRGVQNTTGTFVSPLNYLIPLALVVFTHIVEPMPRFDSDYRLILLVVLLAHPSNYFVRWALNKDNDFPITRSRSLERETLNAGNELHREEVAATAETLGQVDQQARVGRRIGTIERWLILLLVISGNVASLGLVITAKSIVRYPQLGDREFAEYYLFGTLLSVVLALASAFFVLGGL